MKLVPYLGLTDIIHHCRNEESCIIRTYRYNASLHKMYEGHLESKERFAIQRYLLIIGKKNNMQVLSHIFTYFSK